MGDGTVEVDWEDKLAKVKHRLAKIANVPNLSAFGRAFAANAYALSTLLYAGQFAGYLPSQHTATLQKWCAAVVDAALSPEGDLRRPPGIPADCMTAHPRLGGFGLLPLHHHMWSRWACEARDLLLTPADGAPWAKLGRTLWYQWAHQQPHAALQAAANSIWGLCLCSRHILFASTENSHTLLLPQPLHMLALGLRALPPLTYVGTEPIPIDEVCWTAPLWSNPLFIVMQSWDWHGRQRQIAVGLEHHAPVGLLNLPKLQCLGQLVTLQHELQRVCSSNGLASHAAYQVDIHPVYLQRHPCYANRQLALADVTLLMALLPPNWVEAAAAQFHAKRSAGIHITTLMTVSDAEITSARDCISAELGWQLAIPESTQPKGILLTHLTVAAATRLQQSVSLLDISSRHAAFTDAVISLLEHQLHTPTLPKVCDVLSRWWKLRITNTYKESAWRLTLDAFPTTQRMHLDTPCPACGTHGPGITHHFWCCPVATAVRMTITHQLVTAGFLPAGTHLPCSAIWLACLPNSHIHQMVWDLVCLAAVHAMDVGRRTAWAVGQKLHASALVEHIATRAACGAFWDGLADFAATLKVPRTARCQMLTNQPFVAWCTVLVSGNGLRVIRH